MNVIQKCKLARKINYCEQCSYRDKKKVIPKSSPIGHKSCDFGISRFCLNEVLTKLQNFPKRPCSLCNFFLGFLRCRLEIPNLFIAELECDSDIIIATLGSSFNFPSN